MRLLHFNNHDTHVPSVIVSMGDYVGEFSQYYDFQSLISGMKFKSLKTKDLLERL